MTSGTSNGATWPRSLTSSNSKPSWPGPGSHPLFDPEHSSRATTTTTRRRSPRNLNPDDADVIPRWTVWALIVLCAALVAVGVVQASVQTTSQQQSTSADRLADQFVAACAAGTIPARYADACAKALQARTVPAP